MTNGIIIMKLPAASSRVSKRNCAEANPPSLFGADTCLRCISYGKARLAITVGSKPKAKTDHLCSLGAGFPLRYNKLQGILAKANKTHSRFLLLLLFKGSI